MSRTRTMVAELLALLTLGLLCSSTSGFEIEAMKHDVQQITAPKFDSIIGKFRDSAVSSLWFYKDNSKEDKAFLDEYNKMATELKGMAKVCAINCNDWKDFCDKNNVKTTPAVMLYPNNPIPAFVYEGKMEAKALSSKIARFIPDFSVKLDTKEAVDGFLTSDVSKPKVMLFSNKKSPPLIFKALSSETVFKRTVKFGFVNEENAEVVKRFKVKKFPTILMQSGSKSEVKEEYKGDISFTGLKDWVNLRSESGVGDKVQSGKGAAEEESIEDAKPWLVQEVPELTQKSSQDICFKGEGLCVIYLKAGEVSQDETDMLTGLSKKFTSQLSDRGTKFKFMWINMDIETKFKELFEPAMMPSCVIFNPVKRLRFTKLDHGEDNDVKGDAAAITNLMDKVLGGDARFKMVPGQKLPAWAQRDPKAKKKSEL